MSFSMRSVSYTHLDVYKRQFQILSEMTGECGGSGYIQRSGWYAVRIGLLRIQFERQHAGIMAQFGRWVGNGSHGDLFCCEAARCFQGCDYREK